MEFMRASASERVSSAVEISDGPAIVIWTRWTMI